LAQVGNGARGLCRLLQGVEVDVVRIGKGGFFTTDCAYAHALIDIEAAGFDLAFFQPPRFATAVLKIQVGVVDVVRHHAGQYIG